MRFIKTNNSIAEFIETDKTGKIISSRGFQFGVIYFEIKNKKVAFYLDNDEQPFQNFVWSTDIPLTIDDVEYETEEEVSAALHSIFNDRFQEQLDQLKEDLAAEEARAQEAEEQLDDKIDDESARAIAAENRLQDQVTELSGTVATFDGRITRNTNDISALTVVVNDEITRSTAKDAEHDASISSLTNSLNNEISRATSAETSLHNEILAETNRAQVAESGITANLNTEIQNRIADVDAEETRAIAAESGITANLNAEISRATTRENAIDDKVDAEVTRSTAKDAYHDAEISGLSTSLQNEINRAVGAENSLRNDLNAEIANRASGDTLLQSNIDAEEARALAAESALTDALNAEVSRSTAKDASQDALISGLTTSLNAEISRATGAENGLRTDLNAETSARTSADAAQLQRITALEVGKADANNVYTKAESDAKYATKEYISGMTDNFYTKGQTNELLAAKADKVSAVSSAAYNSTNKTIDFKNISGTVISSVDARDFIKDGMVDNVEIVNNNLVITFNTDAGKEAITVPLTSIFDPTNYYTKAESDAKYQLKGDYVTGAQMSAYTYNKQTIDGKVNEKVDIFTYLRHITDTIVHVTTAEKNTWNNKSDFSGNYNDLTNKPTIHTYTAGTGIDITNDVISVTGGSQPVDAYTKAESDAKFATITNFNSHSGNTTMHVTSAEKATWNAKADASSVYNKTEVDNKLSAKPNVWCGNESEWSQISGSTESGTIYLVY